MSMFDKIKEQANRAATGKYSPTFYFEMYILILPFIGAAALGQNATRQVGEMANTASK